MVSGKESELEDVPAELYGSAVWDHIAFRVTYVQHVLFELSDRHVVLTSDRWTSRATQSCLTVTTHHITLVIMNNYLFLAFLCQIN